MQIAGVVRRTNRAYVSGREANIFANMPNKNFAFGEHRNRNNNSVGIQYFA